MTMLNTNSASRSNDNFVQDSGIKFPLIYRKALKKSLTNTNQEEGIHNFRYPSVHRLHPLPTVGNILPPGQYHYAQVAPQP